MKGFIQRHFQITLFWPREKLPTIPSAGGSNLAGTEHSAGFTLIEVILSVAVIGLLTALSAPLYQSFQVRNDLDIAAGTVAQDFRRAIILSRAVDGDISWGVSVESNTITLFKGASFASRDATYDEINTVPTSVILTGLTEVVMAKFSGLPATTGTVTLNSSVNHSRTVTINAQGMVSY